MPQQVPLLCELALLEPAAAVASHAEADASFAASAAAHQANQRPWAHACVLVDWATAIDERGELAAAAGRGAQGAAIYQSIGAAAHLTARR